MRRVRKLPADPAVPDGELDGDQDRLAVLIDADNAHAGIIDGLLAEIARYGVASVKRIYGDWTQPQLGSWKKVLLQHSIVPVQQFGYTKGKNATDSALIIDAMDLMYTRRFDGFCLVSSDSDFTRLASRLREEGLIVYGFGERKTPAPFVSACDRFVYTEVLRAQGARAAVSARAARGSLARDGDGDRHPRRAPGGEQARQQAEDAGDRGHRCIEVEQFAHSGLDRIRQFSRDDDERLFSGCHRFPRTGPVETSLTKNGETGRRSPPAASCSKQGDGRQRKRGACVDLGHRAIAK